MNVRMMILGFLHNLKGKDKTLRIDSIMSLFTCNVLFKTIVPVNKLRIWSDKFLPRYGTLNEIFKSMRIKIEQ